MDDNNSVKKIIVIGGGSAGWLTAGTIIADHSHPTSGIEVTLLESPDIPIIGVGEGTWPTMRDTLSRMGIKESDFIRNCDVSFKQGTRFSGWLNGEHNDHYYHPFTPPADYLKTNLVANWQALRQQIRFADAMCVQSYLCEYGLAPKEHNAPEYAGLVNYAYHLDAGKFSQFLQQHCTETLTVKHIYDHLIKVNVDNNGYISSVTCREQGEIKGDLFIDCSGFSSLLLGQHYKIPFINKQDILFIDSALATQVPYARNNNPIESQTISTAESAGWIWDIGLPSRQGIGHVYCSDYLTDDQAELDLRKYISQFNDTVADSVAIRKISINPGYREKFWHKNCVAVGMSAGFLEPLEASALVMVELSARMISQQLPATRDAMQIVAKRFNKQFTYHWERVIDFLKLHYVLSQRNDDFWHDNRKPETIPDSLQELLKFWKHRFPWHSDFTSTNEIFSSASYQYILYGMGFETDPVNIGRYLPDTEAKKIFTTNTETARQLLARLPKNRALINQIMDSDFKSGQSAIL